MPLAMPRRGLLLLLAVAGLMAGDVLAQEPSRLELPAPPAATANEGKVITVPESKRGFLPEGRGVTLNECLAIAWERQPAIKAAQASLGASVRGYLALMNLRRSSELFSPDLPIRKQQAQKGIAVATADVHKAQQEATYDVCRMYYTFIYALQQEKTASMVIEDMELFYKVAEDLLNQGVPNKKLDQFTLYNLEDLIAKVRKLREKAVLGQKQALYALKEAMGVEPSFPIFPGESELPVMGGDVTMDRVVELALALRPELVQAASAVDVYRLEICAQARIRHRSVHPTFAQGSDLHARILPTPIRNGEYRPGAVPPEMPNVLVGRVEDRVARATELSLRQDAVYEKAYGLIRLEAVNAFLNWQAAAQRADESKKRFDRSRKVVEEALKAAPTKQDPELVVRTEALAGETQAEYVDAVFKLIESLIHLERVTAGGVRPSFPGR
jgi:hypothetical protein